MDAHAIYEYLDYRLFLRDTYRERKAQPGGFSYRAFARKAGLRSPNYLKLVIDGDRSLSAEMAVRFAEACDLDGDALEYFRTLVAFNEAKDADERERCQRLMARFRRHKQVRPLTQEQVECHSQWYIPAICELASVPSFREDPEWIAQRLVPPITAAQASRALEVLVRLGMLVRDQDGRLAPPTRLATTAREIHSSQIAAYHRTMMRHASEAIDRIPRDERDISSLTLAVSSADLGRLKKTIQEFRREVLRMSAEVAEPNRVVQINVQLFPLTDAVAEGTT